jgi:hypothetical protein
MLAVKAANCMPTVRVQVSAIFHCFIEISQEPDSELIQEIELLSNNGNEKTC